MANFTDLQFEGKDAITEAFNSVTSALKEHGYDVLINETAKNEYIPYARFNSVVSEKNTLAAELQTAKANLEAMKDKTTDKETLDKLDALIQQNEALQGQLYDSNIKNAAFSLAKDAIDIDDVISHINKDKIKANKDGSFLGLEEEINRIREAKPHYFKAQDNPFGGGDPNVGGNGGNGGAGSVFDMNSAIRAAAGR